MTREYFRVTPTSANLEPDTIATAIKSLYKLSGDGSEGLVSRLIPFQSEQPLTFEFVAISEGKDAPVEFYYGANARLDEGETVGNGALTTVRWYDGEPVGDGYLRGQFQGLKDVVGDMIDRGVFSESIARRYMMEKLAEWIGDRQELVVPTAESAPTPSSDQQS